MAEILWVRQLLTSTRVTMAEFMWVRQLLTSSRGDEGRGHVTEGGSCQTRRVEACKNKVVDHFYRLLHRFRGIATRNSRVKSKSEYI
jgi:hypothetical protein